ncbi:MAG: ATP-binding cassette domain-containing protein [Burkholderiales bacterium]|nr:ATP-binding cassette domain-containing protein [Burkholderiales bacterium]MDQ3194843.1 ATP-binding cassette domain-containing protein [Pseudomonadota bacterium]
MITLDRVSRTFDGQPALAATTLPFAAGQTTVVIGPSGCGKSTLLRLIAGLVRPDSGRVAIDGVEMHADNENQLRHTIGYVIQDGGLFPHLTARQNVALLARFLKRPLAWITARIEELRTLVNLRGELLAQYPQQLSGGQRQRIALMRSLMLDPKLLLLDEPLGALDPLIRAELQTELKSIFARLQKTVILVTHDMNEAAHFADDIVLLRDGRVVQRGALDDLIERPAEPFVSDFIRAQKSILDAKIREARPG